MAYDFTSPQCPSEHDDRRLRCVRNLDHVGLHEDWWGGLWDDNTKLPPAVTATAPPKYSWWRRFMDWLDEAP